MVFNPEIHHRRSIRLPSYDYAARGGYYVTICAQEREPVFGRIRDGKMVLNEAGKIVEHTWFGLPRHNDHIELDEFVVMPDHFHGIIHIVGAGSKPAPDSAPDRGYAMCPRGAGLEPAPTHGLPEIVRQFKTFSARRINAANNTLGMPVWQRNYYEHIIRNETELNQIRRYIQENPLREDDAW